MPAGEAPPPDAVAPEGHRSTPGAGAMHGDHTIHRILTRPVAAARAIVHTSPLVLVIAAVVVVTMLLAPGFLFPLIGPRARRPAPAAPKPASAQPREASTPVPRPRIQATTPGARPPRT
jgi:hypothetical protein